jgi:hypothetical protein
MSTIKGLKVYKLTIDASKGTKGVEFVSFVDYPAIEKDFMAFNSSNRYQFNAEQRIVTGPVMIPDMPIYRSDMQRGEFYVMFEKPTIKALNEKFMSEQRTLNFNYMHKDNSQVDSVVLVENWIVNEGDNKAKQLGFDVPVGSWMMSVKVNNDKFWQEQIKTKTVKGFSIEGFFDMEFYKIKAMQIKTKDGKTLNSTAEILAVDVELTETVDGKEVPLADGEYELENGTIVQVVSGKITEISAPSEDLTPEEMASLSKIFSKLLEPINAKLAELEVKFENQAAPAPAPAPQPELKPSAVELVREALSKIKKQK